MENRNGLVVDVKLTEGHGRAERETGLRVLHRLSRKKGRMTVDADKGFDSKDFVQGCLELGVTPHIAQNTARFRGRSAIDGRTIKRAGYALSQRMRKRIEELRLGENGWWWTQTQIHRSVSKPALGGDDRRRLQPSPDVESRTAAGARRLRGCF